MRLIPPRSIHVIDSHTGGEPTRVVPESQLDLGSGPLTERLACFRTSNDHVRMGILAEPRGSDVLVGALLTEPVDPSSTAAVIFFNDVGYLGMCGHGAIGVIATLAHLGRIGPGAHRLETPVGAVTATLHQDGSVTLANVASFRYRAGVAVEVPGWGQFRGDIAWGGNWFFLVGDHPFTLGLENRAQLVAASTAMRHALAAQGITGEGGAPIDHIELFAAPAHPANASRNFVLCPGAAFDRSPCGTGTSAKLACLHAAGLLAPGELWRQEGILGTVFEGCITRVEENRVYPAIRGRAWITAESTLLFHEGDPFTAGIRFTA